MRDVNKFNVNLQKIFNSKQHYIFPNGHPMPMYIEDISDESVVEGLDDRRFYSQKFDLNLARLKRWSREFLPPDPLGGLQSGYARQYNPDEAFTVILGGHLVGDLKFTIPEARLIMQDLHQWLIEHEFYFDFSGSVKSSSENKIPAGNYQIAIVKKDMSAASGSGFSYWARGVVADDMVNFQGHPVHRMHFTESCLDPELADRTLYNTESHRVLNISTLRKKFLKLLHSVKSTD